MTESMEGGETADTRESTAPELPDRSWLSSVTIGDYPGLGGDVTVDLSPRCTVLVGRNGAGKSLLLDGIASVERGPHCQTTPTIPNLFQCTVSCADGLHLRYGYRRTARAPKNVASSKREIPPFLLTEHAWKQAGPGWDEIWRYESGTVTFADGEELRAVDGYLQHSYYGGREPASQYSEHILSALDFSARVSSGVPRVQRAREEIFHRLEKRGDHTNVTSDAGQASRLHHLSFEIAQWTMTEMLASELEAFRDAVRRVGVARSIRTVTYEKQPASSGVCEVNVDGVNLGLLSDGTLRILETLLQLHKFGSGNVLLEEPETGIHPGLLSRLLRELESHEGQVIISTHSPQVVSWAKPEEIRLVERKDGKTSVRSLTPQEIERVHEYLSHDGTLGEFVYGGALDDED